MLFPHVGSATVETRKAMGDLQIENLRAHFAGKPVTDARRLDATLFYMKQ